MEVVTAVASVEAATAVAAASTTTAARTTAATTPTTAAASVEAAPAAKIVPTPARWSQAGMTMARPAARTGLEMGTGGGTLTRGSWT